MGKVRIGKVKVVSNEIVSKYGSAFTTDFDTNKKLVYQYSDITSKHLNNRVAGYVTRLLVSQKKREEALRLEEAEIASQEGTTVAAEEIVVTEQVEQAPQTQESASAAPEPTEAAKKTELKDSAEKADNASGDEEAGEDGLEEAGAETGSKTDDSSSSSS